VSGSLPFKSFLLIVRLENDLLDLHIVEDVISFHRLAQWHDLVSHEAVLLVNRHVLSACEREDKLTRAYAGSFSTSPKLVERHLSIVL
jgi:hypothetical protein